MTTALKKLDDTAAAIAAQAMFFSPEQEQMILHTFLGGASKDEAAVLLEVVKRRRLDPFSRQVYFVKRWDSQKRMEVWAIQISIDGLRTTAQRSGEYEGQTAPQWCGEDGRWRDAWLEKTPPAAAKVGVYRRGFREPAMGVARYSSYVQTTKDGNPNQAWRKMDDIMLAKCAEALAIRKAFPEDTGGLYIAEEMGQDRQEKDITPTLPPPAAPVVVEHQPSTPQPEKTHEEPPAPPPDPDLLPTVAAIKATKTLAELTKAMHAIPANKRADFNDIAAEHRKVIIASNTKES